MEAWLLLLLLPLLSLLLTRLLSSTNRKLPPGPTHIPILTSFLWLRKSFSELEPIIRSLHVTLGPIISLRIGPRPSVFISSRALAHQTLIQNGAVFADRPPALLTNKLISSNQHNISSASYGPTWRLLRRNLTSHLLHPSRVKSFSNTRSWVLHTLVDRLTESQLCNLEGGGVKVVDHFQYAMFCLLVSMCFGGKLDESQINKIEEVQRGLLLGFGRFNILNFWPALTKIVLRKKWEELYALRKAQVDALLPLIRARKDSAKLSKEGGDEDVLAYVDTLWELELPEEEKRKLSEDEMVTLCSEFLNAGTDTTSTALQWIMANVVAYPIIQERILDEIKGVMEGREEEEVKEEDLQKMPYLKAVVMEGLRRHPPGHFVLPHSVTEDVVVAGHLVPKNGTVNFMVADMGWDPAVWENPMEFRPERFLNKGEGEGVDITGSREIKMMPFGVGRRICPGLGLALLHLEYFVANLVWKFEWRGVEGKGVDFAEKQEFTMVMKNPLKAEISPRVLK